MKKHYNTLALLYCLCNFGYSDTQLDSSYYLNDNFQYNYEQNNRQINTEYYRTSNDFKKPINPDLLNTSIDGNQIDLNIIPIFPYFDVNLDF